MSATLRPILVAVLDYIIILLRNNFSDPLMLCQRQHSRVPLSFNISTIVQKEHVVQ
jgi:hypothetical protein